MRRLRCDPEHFDWPRWFHLQRIVAPLGIRWAGRTGVRLTGMGIIDEPTICRPEPTGIGGGPTTPARRLSAEGRRGPRGRFSRALCQPLHPGGCDLPGAAAHRPALRGNPVRGGGLRFDPAGSATYFHFETQTEPDETLEVVLRKSPRPVVAVGSTVPESRSVVVAYDASPAAVRALEAFANAGLDLWETVRVVSVASEPAVAARRAEEGARFLRSHHLQAEGRSLPASRPVAELLLEQVQELNAGMLVMGAFGRWKLAEFFSGSTTRTVLENSRAPVFLRH